MRRRRTAALALAALTTSLLTAGTVATTAVPAAAQYLGHHDSSVLVKFVDGVSASTRASVHASVGGEVANRFDWIGVDVVRLGDGLDPLTAVSRYRGNPLVAVADVNRKVSVHGIPNDVLFGQEYGLHNTGQTVAGSFVVGTPDADIDAPEGWTDAFGPVSYPSTGGVRVGIIDTGIDRTHADLLLKTKACAMSVTGFGIVTEGSCEDTAAHGTHVAGTIGAITGNAVGVAGVAPNAEFAVFKAFASLTGYWADVIAGIHWAHTSGGADLINMSLGGGYDPFLDAELTHAANDGALLIASSGNDYGFAINWPAYHSAVVSVGAINASGAEAAFSTCNSDVEIAAPGEDVWSTLPGDTYGPLSGTSMAAPHVSGVAAMIMWKYGTGAVATRNALNASEAGAAICNGARVVNLANAM